MSCSDEAAEVHFIPYLLNETDGSEDVEMVLSKVTQFDVCAIGDVEALV